MKDRKEHLITVAFLILILILCSTQLFGQRIDTIFLKEYRIVELSPNFIQTEYRHKETIQLNKSIIYKINIYNDISSVGQIVLKIKDPNGNVQVTSERSGKIFHEIIFICKRTGSYILYYDIFNYQIGSGKIVISMIKQ